jgi:iron complex outermembrane receptor protein
LYQSAAAFVPGYDGVTTSPTPGRYDQKFDKNYYNASGMLRASYDVSSDLMVYATVSNGFHSGFFNGDSYEGNNPLQEEIITNYEMGLKSSWFDSRLQANASIFRYEFDDIQVSQTAIIEGSLASYYVNAGSATRDGLELDIRVLPVEDLMLSLSYAYMDGNYDKYPNHCGLVAGVEQCITNMEDYAKRARTPDNAVRFFADYVFARTDYAQFSGLLGIDWQQAAAASAVWTGAYADGTPIVSPDIMNDERTLVSLRLAAENIEIGGGQMTVALSGKNLLDDDYSTMGINFGRSIGVVTQNYGEPRTYMLEVSYEY